MFVEIIIEDIGSHVNANGEYSVEFPNDGVFLLAFIRYWRGDQISRVFLQRTGQIQVQTDAEACLISVIMGAFSTRPRLISCNFSHNWSSARTVQLKVLHVLKQEAFVR